MIRDSLAKVPHRGEMAARSGEDIQTIKQENGDTQRIKEENVTKDTSDMFMEEKEGIVAHLWLNTTSVHVSLANNWVSLLII